MSKLLKQIESLYTVDSSGVWLTEKSKLKECKIIKACYSEIKTLQNSLDKEKEISRKEQKARVLAERLLDEKNKELAVLKEGLNCMKSSLKHCVNRTIDEF